jgi:cell division protein FtsQ
MPRKTTTSEDEYEARPGDDFLRPEMDTEERGLDPIDERVLDLEPEQESPFLRAQKRVPVRRGPLPKRAVSRLKYVLVGVAVLAVLTVSGGALYRYGRNSPRFRLESSDAIELTGNRNVTREQVLDAFGPDISRNVFLIPLDERKRQIEQIPWLESATVMRLMPNRIRVEIRERTPVAFVQSGERILLADANGVLMEIPTESQQKYSFPVITGSQENEAPSQRAARLQIYTRLIHDLDSGGANYSRDVDEVNLSDPEDVRIVVTDPEGQVLIHLGSSNFLERYKVFQTHAQEWRQQFKKLESVDLRYDRQVVVNPDTKPASTNEVAQAPANTEAAPVEAPPVVAKPAKKVGTQPRPEKHAEKKPVPKHKR